MKPLHLLNSLKLWLKFLKQQEMLLDLKENKLKRKLQIYLLLDYLKRISSSKNRFLKSIDNNNYFKHQSWELGRKLKKQHQLKIDLNLNWDAKPQFLLKLATLRNLLRLNLKVLNSQKDDRVWLLLHKGQVIREILLLSKLLLLRSLFKGTKKNLKSKRQQHVNHQRKFQNKN